MPGHQDQPVAGTVGKHRPKAATDLPVVISRADSDSSTRCRYSGNEDALRRDPLLEQVIAGSRGRSEMQVGNVGDEPAVHPLRPRRIDVVGPQRRFDMRHPNTVVERRERLGESGRSVALDDDPVGPKRAQNLADPR
jgi:hypothetical protein